MDVLEAMRGRKSTHAYLDQPVARATIESILDTARWAPGGVNCQPWQVAVVTGAIKTRIGDELLAARKTGQPENPDDAYYPEDWQEPYKSRRKATGLALYQALKIGKDDAFARLKAWNNNYRFFGAPVGLLFFVDQVLAQGAWVDMGIFIQNVMLARVATASKPARRPRWPSIRIRMRSSAAWRLAMLTPARRSTVTVLNASR